MRAIAIHRDECGFTLIEMLVAMVLFSIALTLVSGTLVQSFRSASQNNVNTQQERKASSIFDEMSNDLRSARAPQRGINDIVDSDAFQDAVLRDQPQQNPSGGQFDYKDVTYASRTELVLEADVVSGRHGAQPTECVQYKVNGSYPNGHWSLTRTIYGYTFECGRLAATPTGNVISTETLVDRVTVGHPFGNMAHPPSGIFSYHLNYGKPYSKPRPTSPTCINGQQLNYPSRLSSRQLNWISSVTIDLRSVANRADSSSAASYEDTLALRSRQAFDYQHALGCA